MMANIKILLLGHLFHLLETSSINVESNYAIYFSYTIIYSNQYCNLSLTQGLAFQLIDDVLDFTGTSSSLGKGSLSDIRHVIHLSSVY